MRCVRAYASSARATQYEADVHRLYLLTSRARTGRRADDIVADAAARTHDARAAEVAAALRADVCAMARAMVRADGEVGGMAAARARATAAVGHHCYVAASGAGERAGDGLYVRGRVDMGRVVAMYPGLAYVGRAVRYMRGYPRVDVGNAYLMARSDGSVIDGKPWGRGDEGDGDESAWPGYPIRLSEEETRAADAGSFLERLLRPTLSRARRDALLAECESLERANAFAYAHFANHPPKGVKPNVVVASVDVPRDPETRRFVPNVNVEPDDEDADTEDVWSILRDGERPIGERARDALVTLFGERGDRRVAKPMDASKLDGDIRSLVLVATRDIEDGEEVLLNYRLSTHVNPPSWYHRVDAEEDARRWG